MFDYRTYHYTNLEELIRLYGAVGWSNYTQDIHSLLLGLENSLYCLACYDDQKLVGLIRVVGDGHTIIFIQDILVLPDYQRKGIGSMLLNKVLNQFKDVRQIELLTDNTEKTKAFYESCGMRDVSHYGCCCYMKLNSNKEGDSYGDRISHNK